ncbi:MAG: flagellar biosynthesis anti-sigma factor FlgM [Acidimicrobiia bacterium]|jgi:anti-sigma28 factor (negative regulator of flagellin synthesis)
MEYRGHHRRHPDRPGPEDGNAHSSAGPSAADISTQHRDRQEAERMKRVEMLKTAIARGEYRVPAVAVADAILAFYRAVPASGPLPARSRRPRRR